MTTAGAVTAPVWHPTPGPGLTLPGVLEAQVAVRGDQPMLVIDELPVTYRELAERARRAAGHLHALGIGPGDRVAIFMGTCHEWVTLWFALSRLGAVAVPVNTAYRGDFLAHQLGDSGSKMVAVDQVLLDRVLAVAAEVPELTTVLVRPDRSDPPGADLESEPRGSSSLELQPMARLGLDDEPEPPDVDLSDYPVGAIFSTSGTTGRSKGVLATQHYLLSAAQTMVDCWQLGPGEAIYGPLPLFHLSAIGTVLGPMLAGGTGVLDSTFSVSATWERVRRHGAVGIALAGAMLTMLWNLPPSPDDRTLPLRFISAAPVPKETYQAMEERWGVQIVTCYGLSEAFPLTYAGVGNRNPPGASGRVNPDFEVAIFDERDEALGPGEAGQIVCRPRRAHVMFEGYDGRLDATVEQTRNLWFHTGDMGRIDEEGFLSFVDRQKDAMRRRGENISSFEVEQAVLRHPAVAEVAAIGVPSELGEDDVLVCVVTKDGESFKVEEFMDFCCERLPYFAVPRYVAVVDELPKNAVGRVLKHELRAIGVPVDAWDREAAGYVVRR